MICPRCHHHQPDAPDCGRCGLVIAKWNPDHAQRPRAPDQPPLELSPRRPGAPPAVPALALGAIVLVVALAAGAYLLLGTEEEPRQPLVASSPSDLQVLEKEAAELGCPRRIKAPETIEEKAAGDPLPADWLNDAAGWTRATAPDRDPGAPMVVYFGVPWCKYAKAFERDVLADPTVRAALRDHVRVRVNPEAGDTESRVADDFGVKVYPTVVLVQGDGQRRRVPVLRDVGAEIMLGKAEDFVGAVSAP